MHQSQPRLAAAGPDIRLTVHASQRMNARGISHAAVQATLRHGRIVHVRGAAIHAIGRKEISRFRQHGIDLSRYEGIQIVCSPDGTILTVYRNRDFRGLRPRHRTPHPPSDRNATVERSAVNTGSKRVRAPSDFERSHRQLHKIQSIFYVTAAEQLT